MPADKLLHPPIWGPWDTLDLASPIDKTGDGRVADLVEQVVLGLDLAVDGRPGDAHLGGNEKKFNPVTTDSNHGMPVYPNRLENAKIMGLG